MNKRLVILWDYYQHYHLSRFRALRARGQQAGWEVIALAAGQRGAAVDFHAIAPAEAGQSPVYLSGGEGDVHSNAVCRRLWDELEKQQPAVVLYPGYAFPAARTAMRWCRQRRRGAVMMTESQEKDARRSWWREQVKGYYVRRADTAFCAGRAHARYAAKLGLPDDRIFLKDSVVDNDFWAAHADAARGALPAGRAPAFIAVGRFIAKKDFPGLIAAFGRFKQSDQARWELVLVGDGPEREAIRREIDRWQVGASVQLPGYAESNVIASWMGRSDLFVMPSIHGEQWGLVVNEAMAAGLPVIVSDICGCAPDLVEDGGAGLVFDPRQPDGLLAAMQKLAGDTVLRATMARAARSHIARYSLDDFAEQALAASARAIEVAQSRPRWPFSFLN